MTQQQGVPLPGFSTITGLTLGSKRQLLIVLPDFGVYELVDGRLARIYAGPLRFSHLDVFEGLEGVISSSPVGIVVTPDGDVYLGHRSLAVMRLPREGARLTQYLFRR